MRKIIYLIPCQILDMLNLCYMTEKKRNVDLMRLGNRLSAYLSPLLKRCVRIYIQISPLVGETQLTRETISLLYYYVKKYYMLFT